MTLQLECTSCTHFQLCIIFRAFAQILKQHYNQEQSPIQPQQIATICKHYLNNTVITQYQNLTQEEQQQ